MVYTDSGAHPASYPLGTGDSFPRIKRPGREANHLPATSVQVKKTWIYTSTPHMRLRSVMPNKLSTRTTMFNYVYNWMTESSSLCKVKNFHSSISSLPILGPTQPDIQWTPGVKWPGREVDHSPRTSAKAKKTWIYTSTPPMHLHGIVLS
jgi:hypothetical protein